MAAITVDIINISPGILKYVFSTTRCKNFFSTISTVTIEIFNFFKHMSLRYFFETIIMVVPDSCYNFKSSPYAPIFYVQNVKMCIHSEGVRILTFTNIRTFSRLFKMGTVSDFSLKGRGASYAFTGFSVGSMTFQGI